MSSMVSAEANGVAENSGTIDRPPAIADPSRMDLTIEECENAWAIRRAIEAIPEIRKRIGKPVLSSNQSLAWHMGRLNLAD